MKVESHQPLDRKRARSNYQNPRCPAMLSCISSRDCCWRPSSGWINYGFDGQIPGGFQIKIQPGNKEGKGLSLWKHFHLFKQIQISITLVSLLLQNMPFSADSMEHMPNVTNTETTRRDAAHLQHQALAGGQGRLIGGCQLYSEFEASLGFIRQLQKPTGLQDKLWNRLAVKSGSQNPCGRKPTAQLSSALHVHTHMNNKAASHSSKLIKQCLTKFRCREKLSKL